MPSVSRFEEVVPISVVLIGFCSCRCSQRRLCWCWQPLLSLLAALAAVVVLLVGSGSSFMDAELYISILEDKLQELIKYYKKKTGVGIVMGNPWVSQANPYPYPQKPIPMVMGMGFHGYGYGFLWVSWVQKPMCYS